MASPQLENGYLSLANEIVEVLARARLTGAQFQIVLFVFRKTYGWITDDGTKKKNDWISFSQIADHTTLHQRTVKREVAALVKANVLLKEIVNSGLPKRIGFQKDYDLWNLPGFKGYVNPDTTGDKLDTTGVNPDTGGSVNPDTHKRNSTKEKDISIGAPALNQIPDTAMGWWQKVLQRLGETEKGHSSYGLVGALIKIHGEPRVCEQTWDIYQCCLDGKIESVRQALGWLRARFKNNTGQMVERPKPKPKRVIL